MKMVLFHSLIFILLDVLPGQTPGNSIFNIRLKKYQLHFKGYYQARDRQIKNASFNGNSHQSDYIEEIEFDGNGSIYHPLLFAYSFNSSLGLNQGTVSNSGVESLKYGTSGIVRNSYLAGALLPEKKIVLSFGLRRNITKLKSDFYSNSYLTSNYRNIRINYKNPSFPSNINVSNESRVSEIGDRIIIEHEKKAIFINSWGTRETPNGELMAGYSDLSRTLSGFDNQRKKNQFIQANCNYPFGPNGKNFGSTRFTGNRLFGLDSTMNLTWSNNTIFTVHDNIQTQLQYVYSFYQNNANERYAHTFTSQLNHELYLSLFSKGGIIYKYSIENLNEKKEFELSLKWNYQKRVYHGKIVAMYSLRPKWEEVNSNQSVIRFNQQIVRFDNPLSIILSNVGIMPETIVLTTENDMIVFLKDVDYTINPYGSTFEVSRLTGSSIPDSVNIKISYQFVGAKNYQTKSSVKSYSITYHYDDYWGFSIGYQGSSNEFPQSAQSFGNVFDGKKIHNGYLRIDYTPITIKLDHEISTSQITPYTQTEFELSGMMGSYINQYLRANVFIGLQELPLRNATQQNINFSIEYFRRMSQSLRGNVSLGNRIIKGDLNSLNEKYAKSTIKLEHRRFSLMLNYEYVNRIFFKESEVDNRFYIEMNIRP